MAHLHSFMDFLNSALRESEQNRDVYGSDSLDEARSHPELNPKISMMERLAPYKDMPDYYVTFTKVRKVGINPNNIYGTPYGIYCYPLKEMWTHFTNNTIPFAGDSPYFSILHKKSGNMLDYTATNADVKRCHAIAVRKYGVPDNLEDAAADHFTDELPTSNFGIIWTLAQHAAELACNHEYVDINTCDPYVVDVQAVDKLNKKFTMKWNSIMRKDFGYIGAQDLKAEKVIHPNEPIQAVFFSLDAIDVVGMYDNRRYNDDAYFNSDERGGVKPSPDKANPTDLAIGMLKRNGNVIGKPQFFVPYGVSGSDKLAVLDNGTKHVIRNFGIKHLMYIPETNYSVRFENCTFTGDISLNDVILENCTLSNVAYTEDTSTCRLTKCSFGVKSFDDLSHLIKLARSNRVNPTECKIYEIGEVGFGVNVNMDGKECIDCKALVAKCADFKHFADDAAKFFGYLESKVAKAQDKRNASTGIMDLLCATDVNGDSQTNGKTADGFGRARALLGMHANYYVNDDATCMFIPHGSSKSKIKVLESGDNLTVENVGITQTSIECKRLGAVTFKNCVIMDKINGDGYVSSYKNVIFENCVFTEPQLTTFSGCSMKHCTFVMKSVSDIADAGMNLMYGCKNFKSDDLDLYIGNWDSRKPVFDKSTCKIHLDMDSILDACSEANTFPLNGGAFMHELGKLLKQKLAKHSKSPRSIHDTKGMMNMLSL